MMTTATTETAQRRGWRGDAAIVPTPQALRTLADGWRRDGLSVGMVPTMGALHRGHRSLIDRAAAECDRVVVSIFVNPRQFGPREDLSSYPRAFEDDLAICSHAGVAAVFAPSVEAMYPKGGATTVIVGGVTGVLEGASRPGFFDGVATVVAKLFVAGRPDRAYFGQKDAQQCAVVRRLAADLDTGVEIVVCPTVRDDDGLALSSRNAYLSPQDRGQALAIPGGLALAIRRFDAGERDAAALIRAVTERLEQAPDLRVDYVAVVDPETFQPVERAQVKSQILVAARISSARLIDVVRLGLDLPPPVIAADHREP